MESAVKTKPLIARLKDWAREIKRDVVALYLSETGNAQLLPLLCQHLRPSARVVSNVWEMPVPPSRTLHAKGSNVPLHLFERAALMGQT